MKYKIVLFVFCLISIQIVEAQEIIPIWPGKVPNSKKSDQKEEVVMDRGVRISKVQTPTIEVYLPGVEMATGQAVVICPGGGYARLAYDKEGTDIAKVLNGKGIAGIVLKYRLPDTESSKVPHETPLMDAQQAMKVVREHAEEWHIDPHKVGIMGFSAGGHLAATLGTHFDEASRPDFMILLYPVVTMKEKYTHMGSRKNLLRDDESEELVDYYSNELQVKENTPPAFIVHASDDGAVPLENSLMMTQALKEKNIPVELHVYPYGGHGFGLAIGNGYLETWVDRLFDWMKKLP